MIIDLPSTTSSAINKKMVDMREKGGANAQGRVLTLVIVTDEESSEDPIAAANGASFEHPCRVIVVAKGSKRGAARLDAQIRVGGDAGASEVIVLRLYGPLADHGAAVVIPLLLADAPVVAWWPGESPDVPAEDTIGALAQRRITDSAAVRRPIAALSTRRSSYRPGDTDLAWTRLTNWRGILAAALDQPPHERIVEATVAGASDSASADLLAGWLALQLRCPVRRIKVDRAGSGLRAVTLTRRSGEISLVRPEGVTATLSVSNQAPRQLTLPRRILRDCIAEELRRLDADEVYSEVLSKGLDLVAKTAASEPPAAPTSAATTVRGGRRAAAKPAAGKPAAGKPAAADKPAAVVKPLAAKSRAAKAVAAKPSAAKSAATKGTAAKPAAAKSAATKGAAGKPASNAPAAKAEAATPKGRATPAAKVAAKKRPTAGSSAPTPTLKAVSVATSAPDPVNGDVAGSTPPARPRRARTSKASS